VVIEGVKEPEETKFHVLRFRHGLADEGKQLGDVGSRQVLDDQLNLSRRGRMKDLRY